MLYPFIIVGIVILIILLLIIDIYVMAHFQHPDDKNESYFPKAVILFGLLLSELSILLLPIDVANNSGDIQCQSNGSNSNQCGNIDMKLFWQVILVAVIVMLIVVIPFASFYYEADDGSLTGDERKSKCCSAFKYQIIIFFLAATVFLSAYFTSAETRIPVVKYSMDLNKLDVKVAFVPSKGMNPYDFLDLSYTPNLFLTKSDTFLRFDVNFTTYMIALVCWVGWWALSIFGGFGLTAVPFDFIQAFVHRPRVLSADEIAEAQINIQKRTNDLVDCAIMLKRGRAEFKRTATSSSEQRLRWGKDRVELNRLTQLVYILEADIEQLQACKNASQEYNSLIPYLKLLLGIIFTITSILWEVHVILFVLLDPPVSAFLSTFFMWFDGWFPMFGTITYAYFSLYMFFCAVKGCFKFGIRCMCVQLYPMKINGTYLNSFLFNLAIVMLCTVPLVQFCSTAFATYVRYTDLYQIFGIQIKYLRFFTIFNVKNVFIWILWLMAPLTLVYLGIKPSDQSAAFSAEEFKESLQRREAAGVGGL